MTHFFSHASPHRSTRHTSVDYFAPKFNFFLTLILSLLFLFLLLFLTISVAHSQVITVDKNGKFSTGDSAPVDRRYAQIQPTKVDLPKASLDARSHQELIRSLMSEQGFAMRPFPRGHRGLELVANGKLKPAGEAYVAMVTEQGLAAKPGERLLITDLKIENNKIIFDLNGGPDAKHRFLRHITIGVGDPGMDTPVVQGDDKFLHPTLESRIILNGAPVCLRALLKRFNITSLIFLRSPATIALSARQSKRIPLGFCENQTIFMGSPTILPHQSAPGEIYF